MNKNHKKIRLVLKIVGISMAVTGIILEIVGFTNFFNYSNLVGVGYILIFSSIGVIVLGFRREIMRHGKNDISPVISELVKEVTQSTATTICPHCGTKNKSDSKFCNSCGKPLHKICPYCNAELSNNSKFCNACGKEQPEEIGEKDD